MRIYENADKIFIIKYVIIEQPCQLQIFLQLESWISFLHTLKTVITIKVVKQEKYRLSMQKKTKLNPQPNDIKILNFDQKGLLSSS